MAVVRKIRSPQTIGVEEPLPGIGVCHWMLVFASHLTGGSPPGVKPLTCGPRQCGQLSAAACGLATERIPTTRIGKSIFFMSAFISRLGRPLLLERPAAN